MQILYIIIITVKKSIVFQLYTLYFLESLLKKGL